MPGPQIIVDTRELVKALKEVDKELPKELRRGFLKIAARVAGDVAQKLPKGPSGNLSKKVRPRASQRGAGITWPRTSIPYAGFIEFGNVTGRGGGVGPGDSHPRPFRQEGRYIFPTVEAQRDRIVGEIEDVIAGVIKKAGLDG